MVHNLHYNVLPSELGYVGQVIYKGELLAEIKSKQELTPSLLKFKFEQNPQDFVWRTALKKYLNDLNCKRISV